MADRIAAGLQWQQEQRKKLQEKLGRELTTEEKDEIYWQTLEYVHNLGKDEEFLEHER